MEIKGFEGTYLIDRSDCYWSILSSWESKKRTILAKDDILNKRGVYVFFDQYETPIRIGKAVQVRNRLISYYSNDNNRPLFNLMKQEISTVGVVYTQNELESVTIELDLLKKHKPKYNYKDMDLIDYARGNTKKAKNFSEVEHWFDFYYANFENYKSQFEKLQNKIHPCKQVAAVIFLASKLINKKQDRLFHAIDFKIAINAEYTAFKDFTEEDVKIAVACGVEIDGCCEEGFDIPADAR